MGNACCCAENTEGTATVEPVSEVANQENPTAAASAIVFEERAAVVRAESPPETVETKCSASAMIIEFETGAGPKKVSFTQKPMGVTFENNVPLIVNKVTPRSHADQLGVQTGWKFVSIAGTSLDGLEFQEVIKLIKKGGTDLPVIS